MEELASILSILGPSSAAVAVVFMFLKSQSTVREDDRVFRKEEGEKQRSFQAEQREKDRETFAAITHALLESNRVIAECNKVIGENNVIQTQSQVVLREMGKILKEVDSSLFKDINPKNQR